MDEDHVSFLSCFFFLCVREMVLFVMPKLEEGASSREHFDESFLRHFHQSYENREKFISNRCIDGRGSDFFLSFESLLHHFPLGSKACKRESFMARSSFPVAVKMRGANILTQPEEFRVRFSSFSSWNEILAGFPLIVCWENENEANGSIWQLKWHKKYKFSLFCYQWNKEKLLFMVVKKYFV